MIHIKHLYEKYKFLARQKIYMQEADQKLHNYKDITFPKTTYFVTLIISLLIDTYHD